MACRFFGFIARDSAYSPSKAGWAPRLEREAEMLLPKSVFFSILYYKGYEMKRSRSLRMLAAVVSEQKTEKWMPVLS